MPYNRRQKRIGTCLPSSFVPARVKIIEIFINALFYLVDSDQMRRPISKLMIQEGSLHNVQYNSSIYYLNQW